MQKPCQPLTSGHYWAYIKEREGVDVLERPEGFVTIKLLSVGLYMQDIYVAPEFRGTGVGKQLVDEAESIARGSGCQKLIGSCSADASGTESLKAMLKLGFRVLSASDELIYLFKELN